MQLKFPYWVLTCDPETATYSNGSLWPCRPFPLSAPRTFSPKSRFDQRILLLKPSMVILCQAEKACYWRPHIIWFLSYEMSRTEISGFLALEWGWRFKRWQTKNIKFLLFSFLLFATLPDLWDLNSLTKVQTCASCIEMSTGPPGKSLRFLSEVMQMF